MTDKDKIKEIADFLYFTLSHIDYNTLTEKLLELAEWKNKMFSEEKKDLLSLVKMLKIDETNQTIIEDLTALLQTNTDKPITKLNTMKLYAFLNKATQEKIGYLFSHSYANGYVAIPPEHPLYGKEYEEVSQKVSVWGGLTYGEPMSVLLENGWKDDEAQGLVECIGFGSLDEIPKDYYVYGFDTMHFSDSPLHDHDWCIHETKNLQEQLTLIKI